MNMKKGMGQQWTLRMIKLCLKIVRQVNDGVCATHIAHTDDLMMKHTLFSAGGKVSHG